MVHEYITRPVYYVGVHLFYASPVWLAAWALTNFDRPRHRDHKVLGVDSNLVQFRPAAGRSCRQIPGGALLLGQASGNNR